MTTITLEDVKAKFNDYVLNKQAIATKKRYFDVKVRGEIFDLLRVARHRLELGDKVQIIDSTDNNLPTLGVIFNFAKSNQEFTGDDLLINYPRGRQLVFAPAPNGDVNVLIDNVYLGGMRSIAIHAPTDFDENNLTYHYLHYFIQQVIEADSSPVQLIK